MTFYQKRKGGKYLEKKHLKKGEQILLIVAEMNWVHYKKLDLTRLAQVELLRV